MEWIAQNWLWMVFAIFFVGMHLFGHGGHKPSGRASSDDDDLRKDDSKQSSRHRH